MVNQDDGDVAAVVRRLENIVQECRAGNNRLGFFAAMYLTVTRRILFGIEGNEFENPVRMSRLDVNFARRFIDAYDLHQSGEPTTAAWQRAFDGATQWRPIILQQLLVSMNAHINLDLGIAAAAIAPGDVLPSLRADFNKINQVLASMTIGFTAEVATVSPWIGLLDRIGGRTDQQIIRFSIDAARDAAWILAQELASADQADWAPIIAARDRWTAGFGDVILHPGRWMSAGLLVIRMRETKSVQEVIDILAKPTPTG